MLMYILFGVTVFLGFFIVTWIKKQRQMEENKKHIQEIWDKVMLAGKSREQYEIDSKYREQWIQNRTIQLKANPIRNQDNKPRWAERIATNEWNVGREEYLKRMKEEDKQKEQD